jgi:hypothetical protein
MGGKAWGRLAVAALIVGIGTAQTSAHTPTHAICPIRHVCTTQVAAGTCVSYVVHISCRDPHAKLASVPAAERRSFE